MLQRDSWVSSDHFILFWRYKLRSSLQPAEKYFPSFEMTHSTVEHFAGNVWGSVKEIISLVFHQKEWKTVLVTIVLRD